MRELKVYLDRTFVGTLFEQASLWGFAYAESWISSGYNLITGLNFQHGIQFDGATKRPVQWFFDNLLPEEQARTLLEKQVKVQPGDVFSLLTAICALCFSSSFLYKLFT